MISDESLFNLGFFTKTRALAFIDRCSNTPHIRPYPVPEHSFFTTLYAVIFADIENLRLKDKNAKEEDYYDLTKVLRSALLHDLEESMTGDILYPVHNNHKEFGKKLNEVRNLVVTTELFKDLPREIKEKYIWFWKNAKDDSKEGTLVACMDKFEILIFAIQEIQMGNNLFVPMYNNALKIIKDDFDIESVKEIVGQIVDIYGYPFCRVNHL